MKYWQHEDTGMVCGAEVQPSARYYEITREAYEAHPISVHDLGVAGGYILEAELVKLQTKYVALQQAAEAMAERLEYHNRGTTHYEGCEADHPDCAALSLYRSLSEEKK